MNKISSEERRVIDELVELWQTRSEPRDLATHIKELSGTWGSGPGASFIWQVYEDLRTGKRNRYGIPSASEFKQFLETLYMRQTLAQVKLKEREENERRAKADFDALGSDMEQATTRAELVILGQKRMRLVPYTGISYTYENHCWRCQQHISSAIHAQCPACRRYICGSCSSCLCGFLNY